MTSEALTAYHLGLVAGGFGLACALLGAWATYRLTLHLAQLQLRHARLLADQEAFRAAKARLRAAFAPEIAALRVLGDYWYDRPRPNKVEENYVVHLLSEAYPRHSAAIEEFRHYVPATERDTYQEAWEHYYKNGFENYDGFDRTAEPFTTFNERVQAVLRFASI